MLWQIQHDYDPEGGKVNLGHRVPYVEWQMFFDSEELAMPEEHLKFARSTLAYTKSLRGTRIIKTHLPLSMLPPGLLDTCKVFYVARNPKVSGIFCVDILQ